jgi:DNA repair protein RecO (recombination protein O)
MAAEKTKAIVLRVTEFSESSCIAMLLTREFGKQTLIAKGARRAKSPFEAALDVLAICRIVFLHKSSGAMGILTEAKLERRFRNARNSLEWLYASYYLIELLRTLVEEGDPHPDLFDLAETSIGELDRSLAAGDHVVPSARTEVAASKMNAIDDFFELNTCVLRFETGLLKITGHFPLLSHCVGCGRERTTNQAVSFALQAGGIVCPKCRPAQPSLMQVKPEVIEQLNKLSQEYDARAKDVDISLHEIQQTGRRERNGTEVREKALNYTLDIGPRNLNAVVETRRLMNRFMSSLMGFEPRTMKFLESLARPPVSVENGTGIQ